MAQPPRYTRVKNFADDFGHETDHSALNAELDKASNSINDIRFNLAILQADDGRLRPDVVTYDSINPALVRDISADVRADVQDELDRAEAAADRAEAIAAVLDIREAERIAGQIREDAANAGAAAHRSGEAAVNAEGFAASAASFAESAAIAALGYLRAAATGTPDAMEADFGQPLEALADGQIIFVRALPGENTLPNPTLAAGSTPAKEIFKGGSLPLQAGDIAGQVCQFHFSAGQDKWELQNPAGGILSPAFFDAGTQMLFIQPTAPTGWTKVTEHHDKALRIVSGEGGGSGGSVDFTTAFAGVVPISGTVASTTLTTAQIPSHSHSVVAAAGGSQGFQTSKDTSSRTSGNTGATGGSGSHTHSLTLNALNMAVQYVDAIICRKD